MHPIKRSIFLSGLLLCLAAASYGQSLGDVAREQRQKRQNQNPQTAPKVITNEDLPAHAEEDDPGPAAKQDDAPSRPLGSKSAEQWQAEIAAQRNKVTSLQNQIDKLNSSIHFAYGNCVYHCEQYNESQLKKQDEVKRLQGQLDQAKTKLDDLQEAARQEGFGNAVYEP